MRGACEPRAVADLTFSTGQITISHNLNNLLCSKASCAEQSVNPATSTQSLDAPVACTESGMYEVKRVGGKVLGGVFILFGGSGMLG